MAAVTIGMVATAIAKGRRLRAVTVGALPIFLGITAVLSGPVVGLMLAVAGIAIGRSSRKR